MDFGEQRIKMVQEQLRARGITDERILAAFMGLPRENFVERAHRDDSYADHPIPIGPGQTISQPYVVALMLEKLEIQKSAKILEIGTGSGYQTALLAKLAGQVFSIEIDPQLSTAAAKRLSELGITNYKLKVGDGLAGWKEHAPFDGIIVSAAPNHVPRDLVKQLKVGGKMILPVGDDEQVLVSISKDAEGLQSEEFGAVRFVPIRSPANEN